ncbi:hypothetical protein GW17_00061407 [Ensete ventricosum]|nr:hypothetical protein GW17_00061407 [Ensete ventricosum]
MGNPKTSGDDSFAAMSYSFELSSNDIVTATIGDEDTRSSNDTVSIFYSNVLGRPTQPIVDKDEAEEEGYVSLEVATM